VLISLGPRKKMVDEEEKSKGQNVHKTTTFEHPRSDNRTASDDKQDVAVFRDASCKSAKHGMNE